jgi:hypothetical protein
MAQNYASVPEKDLASGINQQAPEDSIPAGFVEHALNVDFNSEGLVEKRAGFRNYLGNLPIRVAAVKQENGTPDKLVFQMTSNEHPNLDIDLSNVPPGPILVVGRTADGINDFGETYTSQYYPTFESNPRKVILASHSGSLSFPQSEHGNNTSNLFIACVESLSQTNKNNKFLFLNGIEIDTTTYDVTLPYDNTDGEITTFVYALELPSIAGVSYSATYGTDLVPVNSVTITAAVHNLNTFNILCRTYEVSGGFYKEVLPTELIVNENTGQVDVTFSESGVYRVMLYSVPVAQQLIDSVGGNVANAEFVIPNLEGDFLFLDCFLRDAATGNLARVMPNELTVDAVAGTATVSFDNPFPVSQNIVFVWEYAQVKSTTITVTPINTVTANAFDAQPELSVYGLVAEELFPTKEAPRSGWVQHIDTYKSEGYNTVVAGLGWNLFQATKQADAAPYLKASVLYPSLRARARATALLAPLFHELVEDPAFIVRTRGAITFEGGASGWARILSIEWSETDQGYWVTLSTPDRQNVLKGAEPLVVPFTDTTRYGDLLSLRGAELKSFDGEWPIWSLQTTASESCSFLIKPGFTSQDYNCLDSGEAGVFTDRFSIDHRPLLTRGDLISAQSFPQGTQLGYIGTDRSAEPYMYVSGVVEEIQVANGQLINLSRTDKYCYGPRSASGQDRSFSLDRAVLRGDSLAIAGRAEPVEVAYVLSSNLSNVTAVVNNEILTLTGVSNARQFSVGQRVLVHDLGYDAAEFEVSEIGIDNSTLTLAAPGVLNMPALTGCIILAQMQLSEITSIADDSFNRGTFTIEGRWEAVEKPQIDTANLTLYNAVDKRMTEHFHANEYGTQVPVRSTMSQNNLYLTNGYDPIQKFDGFNIYRAGVPRWNPQLFVRRQTSGAIATGGTCWYYFRIGGRDANGNFVVGATTGVQDYKVTIDNGTSIHLRLVGLPVWDNYDFEKLTIQIYRTQLVASGTPVPPFYLVGEVEMPQTMGAGYIDFVDTESNSTIVSLPQDREIVSTAGDQLSAVTLSEPLRAKYITSLNNRIVLGNLRGYQAMSLRFVKASAAITFDDFVGKTFTVYNDEDDQVSIGISSRITCEYVSEYHEIDVATIASGRLSITLKSADAFPYAPLVGDWVYLHHVTNDVSSSGETKGVGWFQIIGTAQGAASNPTTTSLTVYAPGEGTVNANISCDSAVIRSSTSPAGTVPIFINAAHADKCFQQNGGNDNNVLTIMNRTAAAINSAMRQVNTNLNGQSSFKPWIMADSGGEFDLGTLRLRKPKDGASFAFKMDLTNSSLQIIYTGLQYKAGVVLLESEAPIFPSRVIYSYQNYPELFNKVDQRLITLADDDGVLPVDVNAADGQEITGIIPFFGESAFGQATRESLLVVFKTNSVYLVDLRVGNDGRVAGEVQKIESQGLGCTAPYSIAPTKDGIMFANESGIYKLTRQLTVEPIGQFVDRIWREEVDLNQLDLAQGHHFGVGRQYKLSVPLQDATSNSDVLVYEHTRESRGQPGSWTRYDNHVATGWANLFADEFFATTHARVCTRRNSATKWDYSDRGSAIVATVALRPNDLGIPNIRKRLLHVSVHFRNPQEENLNISQENTVVSMATDLHEDYYECDKYESQGLYSRTGLSDLGLLKGETIRFSVPTSKAIQFQTKIDNAGIYETLQFSGVTFRIAAMSTKGTKEADDTRK